MDREQLNQLGADENYIMEFIMVPDPEDSDEKDGVDEFVREGMVRLKIAHKLCVMICKAAEEASKKKEPFKITAKPVEGEWDTWGKVRF